MEDFAKVVKNYDQIFDCVLNTFDKYSSTCRVTSRYVLYYTYSDIIVNSDKFRHIHVLFRHIQPNCDIFRTLCNFSIFRVLPYSESYHIQNPRYIQNSVRAYSRIFRIFRMLCNARILRTLSYSEFCHIQNFDVFTTRGIYRIMFIQAHSDIFKHIQ